MSHRKESSGGETQEKVEGLYLIEDLEEVAGETEVCLLLAC